jgi:hypothetical protein
MPKDAEEREKLVREKRHEEAKHERRIKSQNMQLEEDSFH